MDEDVSQSSQNSMDPRLVIDEDKSSQTVLAGGTIMEKQISEPDNKNKNITPDEIALTNLENKLKEFHTIASTDKNESTKECKTPESSEIVTVDTNAPQPSVNCVKTENHNEPFAVPAVAKTAPKPLTPCEEKQVALAWNAAGVFRCPICKFSTDDTSIIENHRTSCMPPRLPADTEGPVLLSFNDSLYKCITCMITWKNRAEFEEHIVCHLLSDPYLCITCMKTFRSRIAIEQHAKQVHIKGESRCGLKGMKKARKIVDNLEANCCYEFRGRLTIPKTPRNQIKVGEPSAERVASANEQFKFDNNSKNSNSVNQAVPVLIKAIVSKNSADQSNENIDVAINTTGASATASFSATSASTTATDIKTTNVSFADPTGTTQSCVATAITTNVLTSTIAVKMVPSLTTSQTDSKSSVDKTVKVPKEKPPQYHVKHFTEYTKEQTVSQSTTTQAISGQSTQMLLLPVGTPTPVGPILHVDPVTKLLVPMQFQQASPDQANWPVRTVQTTSTVSSLVAQPSTSVVTLPDIQNKAASLPSTRSGEQTKFQYIAPKYTTYPRPQVTPVVLSNANLQLPQAGHKIGVQMPSVSETSNLASSVAPITPATQTAANSGLTLAIQQTTSYQSVSNTPSNTSIQSMAEQNKIKEKFSIRSLSAAVPTKQIDPPVTTLLTCVKKKDPPTYNQAVKALTTEQCVTTVDVPTESNNAKKFLFRIKPGQGFVCEACRKFTKDEIVFRRHVWDHFHQQPLACKTCHIQKIMNKDFLGCLLVNDVVLSLLKMADASGSHESDGQTKTVTIVDDVISISDDEAEKEGTKSQNSGRSKQQISTKNESIPKDRDVIVLEDDDSTNSVDNSNQMEIKIASAYSLSTLSSIKSNNGNHISTSVDDKRKTEVVKVTNILNTENLKQISATAPSLSSNESKTITDGNSVRPCPTNVTLHESLADKNQCAEIKQLTDQKEKAELEKTKSENDVNSCPTSHIFTGQKASADRKESFTEQQQNVGFRETEKVVPGANLGHGGDNPKVLYSRVAKADNSQERMKFESAVLENQRVDAFYICGMNNCDYACLTSLKYREHLTSKHAGAYTFVCCHCGVKDYNDDSHVRHMYSHANAKVFLLYNCPVRLCKYKTNLVHMYGEHLKCHKPEDLNIKCVFCHQVFTDITALVMHLKDNLLKFVNCPHCSFKFVNKAVVMKHIQLSHPDKPRMVGVTSQVVCLEREINFYIAPAARMSEFAPITVQDIPDAARIDIPAMLDRADKETLQPAVILPLDKHREETIKVKSSQKIDKELRVLLDRNSVSTGKDCDVVNLKCPHCTYLCYNQRYYREHTAMHTDDEEPDRSKRFICMYCPKGTNTVNDFKGHMSNHIGTHELKIFSCTLCAYQTNQRYNIMDHIQDGHSEKGQYILVTAEVKSNEETCRYCKTFKSRLAEHVQQHEKKCTSQNAKGKSTIKFSTSKPRPLPTSADKNLTTTPLTHIAQSAQPFDQEGENTIVIDEQDNKKGRKYHCHYCTQYFKHKSELRAHIQGSHLDIENKNFSTFKCKFCHYTSTMKEVIVSHMNKKHEGQEVRILRRIETVESAVIQFNPKANSDDNRPAITIRKNYDLNMKFNETDINKSESRFDRKEEIVIPDGNIFSQPFKCTKCSFSNKMRISVMRHIKEHPELCPVREATKLNFSKKATARKSTSGSHEQTNLTFTHQNALHQKASRVENPFTAVKIIVSNLDKTAAETDQRGNSIDNPFMVVKKIVSTLDKAEAKADKQESSDHYVLGGDELHGRLSACFLPLEKELGFRCRICQQKIAKKFVLHRHVLDHLNVVFYKCLYCEQGAIEQTLLLGHIHNEHRLKPVSFDTIDKTEIDAQLRDKIASQNFNDTLNLLGKNDLPDVDYAEKTGIVKKSVHEPARSEEKTRNETSEVHKCHLCKYTAKRAYFLKLHLKGHEDISKIFSCSVCGYRASFQSEVTRHIQKMHSSKGTIIKDQSDTDDHEDRSREQRSSSVDSKLSKRSLSSRLGDKSLADKTDEYKSKRPKTTNSKFVYEMRQLYKCIDCGIKRHSKGSMYDHFRGTKCSRIWYQCVYCNFQSSTKTNIKSHTRIRHAGKKIDVKSLPMSAKIKDIKIPIKTPVVYSEKETDKEYNDQESMASSCSAPSPITSAVYKCQICHKYTSESMMKLQFHFNTKHEGKQVQCEQCVYRTPLIKHMINHCKNLHMQDTAKYSLVVEATKTKHSSKISEGQNSTPTLISSDDEDVDVIGYKCSKCDYTGTSPSVLKLHLKRHLNYRPYCCKYCDMQFKHLKYIKNHIEKIHTGKIMKYSVLRDEVMEARLGKMVEQARKRKERNMKAALNNSESNPKKRIMVDSDVEPPRKKVQKIKSNKSTKNAEKGRSEKSHLLKYKEALDWAGRPIFQCPQCDFKSNRKFSVQCHIGKKHGRAVTNMFKCWYCDFTSRFLSNAYRHVKVVHQGRALRVINNKTSQILSPTKPSSPEKFKKASKDIKPPPTLEFEPGSSHHQRVDVPFTTFMRETATLLSYNCNLCDTEVKGLYNFRQHLTSHDGFKYVEKQKRTQSRLACGYCFYVAKDNSDFSEHISLHLDERRYKCGYCDYTSFAVCLIAKHKAYRHPDDPRKVVDTHLVQSQGFVLLVDCDPVLKLQRCDDVSFNGDKKCSETTEFAEVTKATCEANVIVTKEPGNIHENYPLSNDGSEEVQGSQSHTDMETSDKDEPSDLHLSAENNSEEGVGKNNDNVKQLVVDQRSNSEVTEHSDTHNEPMDEESQEGTAGDMVGIKPSDNYRTIDGMPNIEDPIYKINSKNLEETADAQRKLATDKDIDSLTRDITLDKDIQVPSAKIQNDTNNDADNNKEHIEACTLKQPATSTDVVNTEESKICIENNESSVGETKTAHNTTDKELNGETECDDSEKVLDNELNANSPITTRYPAVDENESNIGGCNSERNQSDVPKTEESKICSENNESTVDETTMADNTTDKEFNEETECDDSEKVLDNELNANSPITTRYPAVDENESNIGGCNSERNQSDVPKTEESKICSENNKSTVDETTMADNTTDKEFNEETECDDGEKVSDDFIANSPITTGYNVAENEPNIGDQSDVAIKDVSVGKNDLNSINDDTVECHSDAFDANIKSDDNGETCSIQNVTEQPDVDISVTLHQANVNINEDELAENEFVDNAIVNDNNELPSEKTTIPSTDNTDAVEAANVNEHSDSHSINAASPVEKKPEGGNEVIEDTPRNIEECSSTFDIGSPKERNLFNDMQLTVSPKTDNENMDCEMSKLVRDEDKNVFEDLSMKNRSEFKADAETSSNHETMGIEDTNKTSFEIGKLVKQNDSELSECVKENVKNIQDSLKEERTLFEVLDSTTTNVSTNGNASSLDKIYVAPGVHQVHADRNVFKAVYCDTGDNVDQHSTDADILIQPSQTNETEELGRDGECSGKSENEMDCGKLSDELDNNELPSDTEREESDTEREDGDPNNVGQIEDDDCEADDEEKVDKSVKADFEDSGAADNHSMSVEDIISDINSSLQNTVSSSSDDATHTQCFMSSTQAFETEDSDTNVNSDDSGSQNKTD